jgi:hypothetical protein
VAEVPVNPIFLCRICYFRHAYPLHMTVLRNRCEAQHISFSYTIGFDYVTLQTKSTVPARPLLFVKYRPTVKPVWQIKPILLKQTFRVGLLVRLPLFT